MKFSKLFLLTFIVILSSSCATSKHGKWLSEHNNMLSSVLSGAHSGEEKLDVLAQSFTNVMHQSLNHLDPRKSVAFVKAYTADNEETINLLLDAVSLYYSGMDPIESIAFGLNLIQKPYFKDFLELFPRFVNKFNQINAVVNLGNKIKSGVLGKAAEKVGLE